jgi:hypothetical protein
MLNNKELETEEFRGSVLSAPSLARSNTEPDLLIFYRDSTVRRKEYQRQYYIANRDRIQSQRADHKLANREQILARNNANARERYRRRRLRLES